MEAPKSFSETTITNNGEITLKELVAKIVAWLKFLWRKKLLLIGIALLGVGAGFLVAWKTPPSYVANLTFIMDEDEGSPLGAYSGLASQFGIDLGGKGQGGLLAGDNIIEFLKTRLIVERALLSPMKFEGKDISLAECYIRYTGMRKLWKKLEKPFNVEFPLNQPRSAFSLDQDSVLNIIQQTIVKKNLVVDKVDKKLSFISVEVKSPLQSFSKAFAESVVHEGISFYMDTKTRRTKTNVDRLQAQADSMKILLNRKAYSTAATQDLNINPARQVAAVSAELAMRDKAILQSMYGEVVRNLEMGKIAMTRETPVIQIIDTPILPLKVDRIGKMKAMIIGGFVAGVLAVMLITIIKFFKIVLN